MRQLQCLPTTYYVTQNKENYLEMYTCQVSWPLSLPLLNIPNCQISGSTANCLYLHDSYISKFEFMNYLFANLVVAWLYLILKNLIMNTNIFVWAHTELFLGYKPSISDFRPVHFIIYPLYTNGSFLQVWYNTAWHSPLYIFRGVGVYFKEKLYSFVWRSFLHLHIV